MNFDLETTGRTLQLVPSVMPSAKSVCSVTARADARTIVDISVPMSNPRSMKDHRSHGSHGSIADSAARMYPLARPALFM